MDVMIIDTRKPSRSQWFEYPTVGERLALPKKHELRENPTDREVVEAILNIKDDESLIIPHTYTILPDRIRMRSGKTIENPGANKFKKYGRHISIVVPKSRELAISEGFDPKEEIRFRFNHAQLGSHYRGYSWHGISPSRNPEYKLVPFTSLIDGTALWCFFDFYGHVFKSLELPKEEIEAEHYGKFSVIRIPSRRPYRKAKELNKHTIRLDLLPITPGKQYADWVEMSTAAGSEEKLYREMSYRRVGIESVFADHEVAAFRRAYEERWAKNQDPILADPFPMPLERCVVLKDTITHRIVIEYKIDDHIRRRVPNEAEENILIGKALGYFNMHATQGGIPGYDALFSRNYDGARDYLVKVL